MGLRVSIRLLAVLLATTLIGGCSLNGQKAGFVENLQFGIKAMHLLAAEAVSRPELPYGYVATTGDERPGRLLVFDVTKNRLREAVDLPGTRGAWSLGVVGDNVYMGGNLDPILYGYNLKTRKLKVLAEAVGEEFIWSIAANSTHVYFGTYPNARIGVYDLQAETLTYLPQVTTEAHARTMALWGHYLFIGFGAHAGLLRYDLNTGDKLELLPAAFKGDSFVYSIAVKGDYLFARPDPSRAVLVYHLPTMELKATVREVTSVLGAYSHATNLITAKVLDELVQYDPETNAVRVVPSLSPAVYARGMHAWPNGMVSSFGRDGRFCTLSFDSTKFTSTPPEALGFDIPLKLPHSLGIGPDRKIYIGARYASAVYDPQTHTGRVLETPAEETKAFVATPTAFYLAVYPGALLYRFPLAQLTDPTTTALLASPDTLIEMDHMHQSRPKALAYNGNGTVMMTTYPEYGNIGGAVYVVDDATQTSVKIIDNLLTPKHSYQGIVPLDNDTAFIGTSLESSPGVPLLEDDAELLLVNLRQQNVIKRWRMQGARAVISLCRLGNRLYGITHETLFSKIAGAADEITTYPLPITPARSLICSSDGTVYLLTGESLVQFTPKEKQFHEIQKLKPLSYVFTELNNVLYFVSDRLLHRYY